MLEEDDWAAAVTRDWLARVGARASCDDPAAVRWYTSYVLRGASPGANRAIRLMNAEIDIRDVLPDDQRADARALPRGRVVSATGRDSWASTSRARSVVELPGNDHLPWEGD